MAEASGSVLPVELVERVLRVVLERPPSAMEVLGHADLVEHVWRAAGGPPVDELVADVEHVVAAADGCGHWRMRHIRGEVLAPATSLVHHDRRRQPRFILRPKTWGDLVRVARSHALRDGGCSC
jgi:hypothetical protein